MRSLAAEKYGLPGEYQVLDLPAPEVSKSDDILIKVHASSLNPVDVKLASGAAKMVLPATLPFKLGYDVSGTVVAAGSGVPSHLKPGTEVYSRVPEWYRGTVSEFALSSASATAPKPRTISHIEAASIPLATLTAYQALQRAEAHFAGGLQDKTIYIPGGLSAVGASAVQLAKKVFHVKKVITTLSTAKIAKAEGLLGEGVLDQVVDYTKEDPTKAIASGSVDFMFDTMDQAMISLHLMRRGGVIVSVSGVPFGDDFKRVAPNMPLLFRGGFGIYESYVNFRAGRYGVKYTYLMMRERAEDLAKLGEYVDQGLLKTVVGRVARLEDLQAVRDGATELYSGKGGVGKFVINVE